MRKATVPERMNAPFDFEEFATTIEKEIHRWKLPAIELVVVKEGEVLAATAFGKRNLALDLPATSKTLFQHGSTGKAFTSFLVGTLVDDGILEWDQPVRDYIDGFRLFDPVMTERITMRDLLSHRTGLPRHEWAWLPNPSLSATELLQRLRYLEPSRDLRQTFQYNNLAYATAGYLVGMVTDSSWEEQMRERVLKPLGMTHTVMSVDEALATDDHAIPYLPQDGEPVETPYRPLEQIAPAGQMISCAADVARWLLCQTCDGKIEGRQIISAATLRETHSIQTPTGALLDDPELPHIHFHGYGLGWVPGTYRGVEWVWHSGGIDGFRTEVAVIPDRNVGILVATNGSHLSQLPFALLHHGLDRLLGMDPEPWIDQFFERTERMRADQRAADDRRASKAVPNTQPSHPISDFAGNYEHPGYGKVAVTVAGRDLEFRLGDLDLESKHRHFDTWDLKYAPLQASWTITFVTDADGLISEAVIPLEPELDPIRFRRATDDRLRDPEFLEKLAGTYSHEKATIEVEVAGESLAATIPGEGRVELEPAMGLRFLIKGRPNPKLEFTLDESGKAKELVVQPGGVFTKQH